MSEAEAPATPETAPEPIDPKRQFASTLVARQFRMREVCSELKLEPAEATALMLDDDVTAHVNRLIATGEYAGEVADARELLEIATSIARTSLQDFIQLASSAGAMENGMSVLGPQSIAAFMGAKLKALAFIQKVKYPSLKAVLKELEKARKRKGKNLDRASVHRVVSNIVGRAQP